MTQQGPFLVALSTLKEGINRLHLEGSPEDIEIPAENADLQGMIILEGDFVRTETNVEIQAHLRADSHQVCDRCLKPIEMKLKVPLRLYFKKRVGRDLKDGCEDPAEQGGLLYYDGRTLDLREEIRQVLSLEVPWHPLCSPDCKGLCAVCGKDKNLGDCGCPSNRAPGSWDALRKMIEAEGRETDASRKKE